MFRPERVRKEEQMSVNYHASQSRGVPFSEHEAVCQQWREEFSGYDPERIRKILHLTADPDYLYLTYYKAPYRLRLADGVLEKQRVTNGRRIFILTSPWQFIICCILQRISR